MNTKNFTTGQGLLFILLVIIVALYAVLKIPNRSGSSLILESRINGEVRSFDKGNDFIDTAPDSKEIIVIEEGYDGNISIKTQAQCEANAGVWYEVGNVCEINTLSQAMCAEKGGEWNECASACRHDPKAEMCTMQCVMTCSFR